MPDPLPNSPRPRGFNPDAVHRALLTGLLGSIGMKSGEAHEYAGPHGLAFNVFPGSALFKKKPQWVMAAELVQTTKLYARTLGPIRPEWVERAAGHLVKRESWDPHWSITRSRVEAWERVTLYGLTVVPKQSVHYGPIEPKLSRDLFILHALVRGEFRTEAPFFKHNGRLIEQVLALEAKARRRDVLADEEARFKFFDARVPQRVYDGIEFEKWLRQAERQNRRVLFMERDDVTVKGAAEVSEQQFPDRVETFPLEYRYEPGHAADGVTVTVPLAALNALPDERFEWLVPGMLREKAIALIRSLPRPLRVQLVPAPEVADAVLAAMPFAGGPLLDVLALHLGKRIGGLVPKSAFDLKAVPEHLFMTFKVVDGTGKPVATGRDLTAIRTKLGVKARESFASMPPTQFHRDKVVRWDFGDLPLSVEIHRHGLTLLGFPALKENRDGSVALRLFDSEPAARAAHRDGLRRLFMIQVGSELKYILSRLKDADRLAVQYATIGGGAEFRRDLAIAVADAAFYGDAEEDDGWDLRIQPAFAARAEAAWKRLAAAGNDVARAVSDALALHRELSEQLGRDFPPMLLPSARDMREQFARLVRKGFVAATPYRWLRHYPRYLKGLQIRLSKLLNAGLSRDAQHLNDVAPLWRRFLAREQLHHDRGVADPALERYRWAVEELRVSLFAQELKTPQPVSVKRLNTMWEAVPE
jgi:ATP-dependent helicase HrpA